MFNRFDSVKWRPLRAVMTRVSGTFVLCTMAVAVCSPAFAQGTFEAVQNYSTDGTTRIFNGTLGWSFQTASTITVTALGCFTNALPGQGMEIGLWQSNGSLLASNLITTVSAMAGLSRYESISPIFLQPGQTYYLGAYNPGGSTTLETYIPGTTGPLTLGPGIALGSLASGSPNFAFPSAETGTGGDMYLGANFIYQQGVPEPSCLSLVGLAGFAAWRNRTRRVSRIRD